MRKDFHRSKFIEHLNLYASDLMRLQVTILLYVKNSNKNSIKTFRNFKYNNRTQ